MPLYDYDQKTGKCKKCDIPVDTKLSKNNNPYMVNKDGSIHVLKAEDGKYYHCANKNMVDYVEEYGNLTGYVPSEEQVQDQGSGAFTKQPSSEAPDEYKPMENLPKEALVVSDEYERVLNHFSFIAKNLVTRYGSENPGATQGMHINNMWARYMQIKGALK